MKNVIYYSEWKQLLQHLYFEYVESTKEKFRVSVNVKKGDFIHLHNRGGSYQIVDLKKGLATISCKKWVIEYKRKDRTNYLEVVHVSKIKCLHGDNSRMGRFNVNVLDSL